MTKCYPEKEYHRKKRIKEFLFFFFINPVFQCLNCQKVEEQQAKRKKYKLQLDKNSKNST